MIFHLNISPETLGNVGILFFLLDHQASLPSEGNHRGQDGELVDVGVEVVQPELVHRQEGPGSSHAGAAVHQDRALVIKAGGHWDFLSPAFWSGCLLTSCKALVLWTMSRSTLVLYV